MEDKAPITISIVGTGNVASALVEKFQNVPEISLMSVFSRQANKAEDFAKKYRFTHSANDISQIKKADFIIISIKDDAVSEIVQKLPLYSETIYCHTAGSIGADVFNNRNFEKFGVFYPLQSFTSFEKNTKDDFPLLVEGNSAETTQKLLHLAKKITVQAQEMNAEQRAKLHVAAVMVNNFTNYIFTQAQEYCLQQNLPFELLKPLILKTAQRAVLPDNNVWNFQTGPAVRNDNTTIKKHLEILSNFPAIKEMYQLLTQEIIEKQKQNNE